METDPQIRAGENRSRLEKEVAGCRLMGSQAVARVLTPVGRGAVATIAVSGIAGRLDLLDSLFKAVNRRPLSEQAADRMVYGRWGPTEDVVLCVTPVQLEIHCHGGRACVERILQDLAGAGIPEAAAREFRSIADEPEEALKRCLTLRTARLVLRQQRLWRSQIADWRRAPRDVVVAELDQVLSWTDFGLHLTDPRTVAIVGPPNVGKSSLFNAMLGFTRSIVFDEPGTTRDVVAARTVLEGWPIRLSDTAGVRSTADDIERAGLRAAARTVAAADLTLVVLDATQTVHPELPPFGDHILVANKSDCPDAKLQTADMQVSALHGDGIELLCARIVQQLVPVLPPEEQCVPVSVRQHDALVGLRDALQTGTDRDVSGWLTASESE